MQGRHPVLAIDLSQYFFHVRSVLPNSSPPPTILKFDRGQTREIAEKQEKYFKGKVVTFTVQTSIL